MSTSPRPSLKFGEHALPEKDHAALEKNHAHLKQIHGGYPTQQVHYSFKAPNSIKWEPPFELEIPHQREAMAAVLMLALSMNTGCAAIVKISKSDDEIVRHAFQRDDYLEAEAYKTPEVCKGKENMCEVIKKGVDSIIDHHIQQITELTNKSFEENDYLTALEHCRRVKGLLKDYKRNGKRLKAVQKGGENIRKILDNLTKEYDQTFADLEKQAGKAETLDEAGMSNVKAQFMRLKQLSEKLRKDKSDLKPLADKFTQHLYDKKQYLKAHTAIQELTKEVNNGFNEDDELFLGTVRFKAIPEIKEKIHGAEIALMKRQYNESSKLIQIARAFNLVDGGLLKRIRIVERKIRRKTSKKRWLPPKSNGGTSTSSGPTKAELVDKAEKEAMKRALKEIKGLHSAGDTFDAFASLEEAIQEFKGSKYQKELIAQRRKWKGKKAGLIKDKMRKAKASMLKKTQDGFNEAIEYYEEVLELQPGHAEAIKNKNFLERQESNEE